MAEAEQAVFDFLINTLRISGAPHNVIGNELIMAQCQVEIPRSFFRPARIENLNLQMVCQPELLTKYPGSELVNKGSFRLQWFAEGIKQRGLITKGACPYDLTPNRTQREIAALLTEKPNFFFERPWLTYHPHLLVNFKVSFATDEKFDELYSLSINLTNGEIASDLLFKLIQRKLTVNPPKHPEKRKIAYRDGFNALLSHLKWLIEKHDRAWVDAAQSRWEDEVKYLETYYQEDNYHSEDDPGFYRRVAEAYRKFRPVIQIEVVNVAIINLPIVVYTVEFFQSRTTAPLLYDPIFQKIKWIRQEADPSKSC